VPSGDGAARAGGLEVALRSFLKRNRGVWFGWSGRVAARNDLQHAWRGSSEVELRGKVTVSVRLSVPVLIPGIKSPVKIGTTADTVLEDGGLSDRQDTTPSKNKYGVDGNWN
jgi:hypothetical protein